MIHANHTENVRQRFVGIGVSRRQVNMMFDKPSIVDNLIRTERLHPVVDGKQTRFDLAEVYVILQHFGAPTKPHSSLTI